MVSTKYFLATAIAVGAGGAANAAIVTNPNFSADPANPTGYVILNWTPTVGGNVTGTAESNFNLSPTPSFLTTGIWNNGSVSDGQHGADGFQGTVGFETVSGSAPVVGLAQTLALIVGHTYKISYYANATDDFNGVSVGTSALINGVSVLSATTGATEGAFNVETGSFTATAASDVLTLDATQIGTGPATLLLADVVVTDTTVATPEPASLALLGAGLAITGLIRRRRA